VTNKKRTIKRARSNGKDKKKLTESIADRKRESPVKICPWGEGWSRRILKRKNKIWGKRECSREKENKIFGSSAKKVGSRCDKRRRIKNDLKKKGKESRLQGG